MNRRAFLLATGAAIGAAAVPALAADTSPAWISFDCAGGVAESVTVITQWIAASRRLLDDAPMLQSYVDARLVDSMAASSFFCPDEVCPHPSDVLVQGRK